ncbi:MAG: hypothetical protein WAW00_01230 [Candidatus Moraniibacteriota bacterium]
MTVFVGAAFLFLNFFTVAQAADKAEEESSPSNSIELVGYRGGDPRLKAYFEYAMTDDIAMSLSASKSKGFGEVTVGPAYYITPELQVGVSVGVAHYATADEDKESNHKVVSGFVYYKSDAVEGELSAARYNRDPDPTWYQTYVQWSLNDNWAAGIFGEAAIGWGPRISWTFHKNMSLWVAPIVKQLGDDDHRRVGGIAVAF